MATQPNPLPQTGFSRLPPEIGLRLSQSVGDEKTNTNELIPIGKTTFLQGVIPFGGSFGYSESKNEPW
ncbi:hypothetical protein BCS42_03770 [Crenothrix sp. D3]|jgi:hypothetical protein|nr:hypothetical protein BCS42_03770 [Crenothrix sp. D3]